MIKNDEALPNVSKLNEHLKHF